MVCLESWALVAIVGMASGLPLVYTNGSKLALGPSWPSDSREEDAEEE